MYFWCVCVCVCVCVCDKITLFDDNNNDDFLNDVLIFNFIFNFIFSKFMCFMYIFLRSLLFKTNVIMG